EQVSRAVDREPKVRGRICRNGGRDATGGILRFVPLTTALATASNPRTAQRILRLAARPGAAPTRRRFIGADRAMLRMREKDSGKRSDTAGRESRGFVRWLVWWRKYLVER